MSRGGGTTAEWRSAVELDREEEEEDDEGARRLMSWMVVAVVVVAVVGGRDRSWLYMQVSGSVTWLEEGVGALVCGCVCVCFGVDSENPHPVI